MYVPELRNNLSSESSVTDNDYTVTFKRDQATNNQKDGSVVLTATKRIQLYVVNEKKEYAAFIGEKNKLIYKNGIRDTDILTLLI